MAPSSRSQPNSKNRLKIPTLTPLHSSPILSSSTSDLDSTLPRDLELYAQTSDRPSSARSLPPSQYRKNMKDLTGFDTTEDEFDALPLAVRRKYFSTLERLRFAERANSQALNELPIQRPRKSSIADRRNAPVVELRRRPSSRRLRNRSSSSNDASWFLNLPPKVKRKNFTKEERVVLDGRLQDKIILDAADEAVLRHRMSRVIPQPLGPKVDFSESPSPQTPRSIYKEKIPEPVMAETMYDSFRWMDEESDLDLRLVLDDYHANLEGVVIPSPTSNRRPSFRRQMSISKIPFGRSSLSSIQPRSPKTETPPVIHNRQKSRAMSLIAPKHQIQNSVSSIDPNATHYQDPEARLKLRVYLASPQKFDEAIEFGFPSMDGVAGADKENKPPMRLSKDIPEIKRSFATEAGRSFLDDAASLFEDDISMADPDSPITPLGADSSFSTEHRSSISAYGTKSSKTSVDFSHLGITKPTLIKQPDSYAQAAAGSREMTLRMTLTRPDLRADETTIYGWQSRAPLREASLDDLDEKQDTRGPFGGHDGWGPAEKENGVVKRLWNRVKGRS